MPFEKGSQSYTDSSHMPAETNTMYTAQTQNQHGRQSRAKSSNQSLLITSTACIKCNECGDARKNESYSHKAHACMLFLRAFRLLLCVQRQAKPSQAKPSKSWPKRKQRITKASSNRASVDPNVTKQNQA